MTTCFPQPVDGSKRVRKEEKKAKERRQKWEEERNKRNGFREVQKSEFIAREKYGSLFHEYIGRKCVLGNTRLRRKNCKKYGKNT